MTRRASYGLTATLALAIAGCSPPAPQGIGPAGAVTAKPVGPAVDPTAEWLARGSAVYARECASCHGAYGEGQPNWAVPLADGSLPAPPHDNTGHTWHHSDAELTRIIAEGGLWYSATSKMPAFGDKLSGDEVQAVLAHIKTWWGPRERAWQADVNWQWAELNARASPAP